MDSDDNISSAFTGLEAAIVLIAFVVVAAVFSYVVLGTGFMTTQKSQEVVHTGVSSASSTIYIAGTVFGVGTEGVGMDMINFSVTLAAGSTPVDFEKVVITYSNESTIQTLTPVPGWQSTSTTAGSWAITGVQGEIGGPNNLLQKSEQFAISVHPSTYVPRNSQFMVEVKPSEGATLSIVRTAPAAINAVNSLT